MTRPVLENNIAKLYRKLRLSAEKCHRPAAAIRLVAASKSRPAQELRSAYACGIRDFGESYLQEALGKIEALADLPLVWHFIGPIQTNKTRPIAEHFDWVHSVDREKIARRLSAQRPASLPPLNLCIQVNISGEASKSGVAPGELAALAATIAPLPRVVLRGLMAIPAASTDPAAQRAALAAVRRCFEALRAEQTGLDTLSMGMSADFEAAIAEGSTMVRIGTALFGPRDG